MASPETPSPSPEFLTTRWSVVRAAGGSHPSASDALATLCKTYWFPLYAFVRRKGYSLHDAQDLTQSFFSHLLEKQRLAALSPDRGRFRSFLLVSLKNFLANEWHRSNASKRGGQTTFVFIDDEEANRRYGDEPAETISAEQIFDRRWALTLLERVLDSLRQEMVLAGKSAHFEALKFTLTGETGAPYGEIASQLGTSEGALKVFVHRLRERYRSLLREEIAQTVETDAEIDDELRHLIAALSM
jgi:RNA polymerase sigma-70 factor (ECF subfamily)